MPRTPRVFVEGGIYHVYNRFTSGEDVFSDPEAALEFLSCYGLWQSRYQAKPIREQRYLDRVVLFIHLNPVAGGLAEHPTDHVFGGHREIAKRIKDPLIDPDEALLSFGETEKAARKSYFSSNRIGCRELGRQVGSTSNSVPGTDVVDLPRAIPSKVSCRDYKRQT